MPINSSITKRASGLDFLKYICAFLIITIHISYPYKLYIEPLIRYAVPIFFMITGYFYSSVESKGQAPAQIKKIFRLFLAVSLFYFIWIIFRLVSEGHSCMDFFRSFLSISSWVLFFFFNSSFLSEHLWYIRALLYVLIILYYFEKYFSRKHLYKLIPILLLVNIAIGNYSVALFGHSFPVVFSRNFLFMGLPFFLLGDYFKQKNPTIKNWQLLCILIGSLITTELENLFLIKNNLLYYSDCFISTPFLACSLFLLVVKNENALNGPIISSLASLGRNTATTVYIIHPILIHYITKLVKIAGKYSPQITLIYDLFAPVVIFIASTALALLLHKAKQKMKPVI